MRNIAIKKKVGLLLIVLLSILSFSVVHASIIDDFLSVIGANKNTDNHQIETNKINEDIEGYLDSRQREVVDRIDDIYKSILDVDFNSISEMIDYSLPAQVEKNVSDFFENYDDSKNNVKSILKTINYKIENVTNEGDKIIAKITYTYPLITKVITKVLPEVLMKNPGILFGGSITNDTIDSILKSVKNELEKGRYDVESFQREFTFKEIDGTWKLVDVAKIINDITHYIDNIGSTILS